MLLRYSEFKHDFMFESLLLESKLVFSNRLYNLISSMPDSNIKSSLLNIISSGNDLTINQNFFDLHDEKDKINFIQDRKAQEILGSGDIKWSVDQNHRRLTLNKDSEGNYKNKAIFDALGFDPETMGYQKPSNGQIGEILAETPSKQSPGKIYVLFKWSDNEYSIYDKAALSPRDERIDRVWQLTKNPINVGRGIRGVLTAARISFSDRELEEFVNSYKSTFDIMNDAFLKFDIVKGDDIREWYNYTKYESMRSTLGNSCMAHVDSDYFDIYALNPKVCSLVILYSDNGRMVSGKWESSKIRGRALLWKTTVGDMFLDRIYTNNDADIDLFKRFAEKNGWWYKSAQDNDEDFTAKNGTTSKKPRYMVDLDNCNFDYYPYLDTLCYLSEDQYFLSNHRKDCQFELRSDEGERYGVRDEEDDDDY